MVKKTVTRRDLLGYGAAGTAALLAGLPSLASAASHWGTGKKAKNIVFCVADGMSAAVPSMLDQYLRLTTGKGSFWAELMSRDYVVNGLQDTRSLTGPVTDSSAASSSWGSGVHIWNGAVNWLPQGLTGLELRSLFDILKSEGKMKTGLVSTATITHATPAGFAISHHDRDDEEAIAAKYLSLRPDVLLGGGDKFFSGEERKDKVDLYAKFASAGYSLAKNSGELAAAPSDRGLLGIFSSGHMPYTVDTAHDEKLGLQVPSLARMTSKAIEVLNGPHGFILQVEGARVDHGGHTNDFAAQLFDQMAFEEAVAAVVEFALKDGETLVVITSDHGNGNPGLAGAGDEYADSGPGLLRASQMTCSFGPLMSAIKERPDVDNVIGQVKDRYAIELNKDEAQFVVDGLTKVGFISKVDVFGADFSHLAIALSNHTHVNYMTHAHTSDHVMVTALGPGCESFFGLTKNLSYFNAFLAHRDLKWKNPTVSYEDARKHYLKETGALAVRTPHWA